MNQIKTVCVYCGSGPGTNPRFVEAAKALGKIFAENDIRLVYGGGSLGLMGAIATSVLDHGGTVTGIIPDFLRARENALTRVQEMIVTPDMHERKRLMFERSDAFVALPGGIGTLEELVEQLTWQQLGRHAKPVLLANIDGFWEPLLALLTHMRATEFIRPALTVDILKADRVEDILPRLRAAAARAPEAARTWRRKWRGGFRASPRYRRKRHRLDPVAVGIDDERRVIFHAIMRPQARRAVGAAAGGKRCGVERIDIAGCFGAQADVRAALGRDLCHAGAQIDPELRIGLAEADRRRPRHEPREAERGERCLVETRGAIEIGDADGDVVDHGRAFPTPSFRGAQSANPESRSFSDVQLHIVVRCCASPRNDNAPHAGAPDFTSL